MCRGTFLVEHHFRLGQHLADDVPIRPVHIRTNGLDGGALAGVHPVLEQRAQTVLAPILLQPDHLAAHEVGEDGPEVLPLAALDFIDAQMARPPLRPGAIPRFEKGSLRAPGCAPAHRVPYGRVTRRHRLTVEPNPLAEPARQPRVGISKGHALGPDATGSAPETTQGVPQRHRMLGPRHVVPRAHLPIADAPRSAPAPRTDIRRIPRRSISMTNRPSSARSSSTTRYVVRPRIHVQLRSDPTRSSLSVVTQREHHRPCRWLA